MSGEHSGLRVPPSSIEAEHAVLSALLFDNSAFETVGDVLEDGDFFATENASIYRTISALIIAGKPADVLTVHEHGGHAPAYVNAVATTLYGGQHARRYAEIVREKALRRRMIALADELATACFGVDDSVVDLADEACTRLVAMMQGSSRREPRPLSTLLPSWIDDLQERANGKTDAIGTGLTDVDRLLAGGPRPGEVFVIGARPSMGKSALSLTIARNMARTHVVLFASMEDSETMLISRQVAAAGKINLADIRRPEGAGGPFWDKTIAAIERLTELNLHIDDTPALTIRDVRVKAQQVRRRAGKLHVVMLDYLQLMEGNGETRAAELTAVARALKRLAKDLGVTVIILSQLSREADKMTGPPRLDHLAESGGIEQAADIIGLLWREARSKPKEGNKHDAQIEFAKNKNGPTGTVKLWFDGATQRFEDAMQEETYG